MAYVALEVPQRYSIALAGRGDVVLHITLAHLGKITCEQGQIVASWLARAAKAYPHAIHFLADSVSVFGTPESPVVARVVKPVVPNFDLVKARTGIVDTIRTLGIAVSDRFEPWIPHVTVGTDIGSLDGVRPSDQFFTTRIGLFAAPVFNHYSFPLGD